MQGRKKLQYLALGLTSAIALLCGTARANTLQKFGGLNFDNPAKLSLVKHQQLVIGSTYIHGEAHFAGTSGGSIGNAKGDLDQISPYFRYAARLSKRLVAGLDVTEPYSTSLFYPYSAVVRRVSTRTYLRTTNISPRLSFNITDKFAIGAGFNAQYMDALIQRLSPLGTTAATRNILLPFTLGPVTDWGYGWDAGMLYTVTPYTFAGLTYYSRMVEDPRGISTYPGKIPTTLNAQIVFPPTTGASLTQIFSKHWLVNAIVFYTQWNQLRKVPINNSVIPTGPLIFNYNNTWREMLVVQYMLNKKWAFRADSFYDETPASTRFRSVALPAQNMLGLGGGIHYQIIKSVAIDADYLHSFFAKTYVNNPDIVSFGAFDDIRGDTVDARLTWSI